MRKGTQLGEDNYYYYLDNTLLSIDPPESIGGQPPLPFVSIRLKYMNPGAVRVDMCVGGYDFLSDA